MISAKSREKGKILFYLIQSYILALFQTKSLKSRKCHCFDSREDTNIVAEAFLGK